MTGASSEKVGERIRSFREKQELSLDDMVQRTGLDRDFLEAVEGQTAYPSLGPLIKIARALGVRLGTFLDDQSCKDPLVVRFAERSEQLETQAATGQAPTHTFYSLGKGKGDRHMEPFFIEIEPAEEPEDPRSSHEGEEFIIVVSGSLKVIHGREVTVLGPGDSIYFNSIVPHWVGCAGSEKTEIYAVIYIPQQPTDSPNRSDS